jgi:hypothetical protein
MQSKSNAVIYARYAARDLTCPSSVVTMISPRAIPWFSAALAVLFAFERGSQRDQKAVCRSHRSVLPVARLKYSSLSAFSLVRVLGEVSDGQPRVGFNHVHDRFRTPPCIGFRTHTTTKRRGRARPVVEPIHISSEPTFQGQQLSQGPQVQNVVLLNAKRLLGAPASLKRNYFSVIFCHQKRNDLSVYANLLGHRPAAASTPAAAPATGR